MTRQSVLLGGVEVPIIVSQVLPGLPVKVERKLQFARGPGVSRRTRVIDTLVMHWTGAENPATTVFQTLTERTLGVEFIVDRDALVWQCCDPLILNAHDCGGTWDARSASFEIVNAGDSSSPQWRSARNREREEEHWAWGTVSEVTSSSFFEEQVHVVVSLILTITKHLGISRDVCTLARKLDPYEQANWQGGIVGHMHFSKKGKRDPGLPLMQRIAAELEAAA